RNRPSRTGTRAAASARRLTAIPGRDGGTPPSRLAARPAALPAADLRPAGLGHPGVLEVVAEQFPRVEVEELQGVAACSLEHDRVGLLVDPAAEAVPVVDAGAAVMEPRPVAVRQPGAEDRDRLGDRLDELVLQVAHPDEGHLECLALAALPGQDLGRRLERD